MAKKEQKIQVPDIGGAENVDVIEVLVASGDAVAIDDSLITLESDKATMEVPATMAGVVKQVHVKVGDKLSEGGLILSLEVDMSENKKTDSKEKKIADKIDSKKADNKKTTKKTVPENTTVIELKVPDIGGATDVDLIEVSIKPGDEIAVDDTLITLEGDKATMDVPATIAGKVKAVVVKVGDKLSQDAVICTVTTEATVQAQDPVPAKNEPVSVQPTTAAQKATPSQPSVAKSGEVYASPAVRRIAHEFDVALHQVIATGPKGRITKDDIKKHIAGDNLHTAGLSLPSAPQIDFSKFGEIEYQALSKIQKNIWQTLASQLGEYTAHYSIWRS